MKQNKKCNAFTLAEVLITLGIIGVVAAMTLPTLITNYQKKQTVVKLKREYNVISNAIRMSTVENGDVNDWEIGTTYDINSASIFATKYIVPYLSIIKNCETITGGECEYSYTNGLGNNANVQSYTKLILNDGAIILVRVSSSTVFPRLVSFVIDINGNKKPNTLGKDVFLYALILETTDDMYKPIGRLNASGQSQPIDVIKDNCQNGHEKTYCSALIIHDGWEMTKDYPW